MELWIRSQDKEKLLKVDEIHLGLNKEYVDSDIWVNNWIVGEYETKERALEVLDEIQKILLPKGIIKFNTLLSQEDMQNVKNQFKEGFIVGDKRLEKIEMFDTYVYEMPEN